MAKDLSGAGLRGQSAGETSLCTVGKTGSGLTYRGYDITELAEKSNFEEVAFLLSRGHLPTANEYKEYINIIKSLRDIPQVLKEVLQCIPADSHPMDVLRTGCSFLGNLEAEQGFDSQIQVVDRLLAILPSIICYWYRYCQDGTKINTTSNEDSLAGHFLHMLHDASPEALHRECLDTSLILYAEHEFNASTFAARVCASTLSDLHSCISSAIGTLRGKLHGGANEAAMAMIINWKTANEAESAIMNMLSNKEKIMGFGHAVYRECDPRNAIVKDWSQRLSKVINTDKHLYEVSERVEAVMKREKNLFANADFYHASAYHFMGIPTSLFTPIFVLSRVTGWTAHVMEQRANNRLIRPCADYIGSEARFYLPIEQR